MYFAIRNGNSVLHTVFNGFVPRNSADLNLLRHCYGAINTGGWDGYRPAKFSGIRQYSYSI